MKLPPFEYACPATLDETVSLLRSGKGDAKPLAGGQSLLPMMAFRLASPSMIVDLRNLPGLRDIEVDDDGVRLGAMVRWCDILKDTRLRTAHPLLVEAVGHVAHYQIRNRGTVGGSLAHADPAAELPGVAVTCGVEISVVGPAGSRVAAAGDFFLGPLTTALAADEIITAIRFPAWPPGRRWGFQEFARRRGDFAMAAAAVHFDLDREGKAIDTRVGLIGVGGRPQRLPEVETAIDGRIVDDATIAKAKSRTSALVEPSGDIHASAAYRRSLAGTMVERALRSAIAR